MLKIQPTVASLASRKKLEVKSGSVTFGITKINYLYSSSCQFSCLSAFQKISVSCNLILFSIMYLDQLQRKN